jgi:hypothetical protein
METLQTKKLFIIIPSMMMILSLCASGANIIESQNNSLFSSKDDSLARFDGVEEPAALLDGVPDEQKSIDGQPIDLR